MALDGAAASRRLARRVAPITGKTSPQVGIDRRLAARRVAARRVAARRGAAAGRRGRVARAAGVQAVGAASNARSRIRSPLGSAVLVRNLHVAHDPDPTVRDHPRTGPGRAGPAPTTRCLLGPTRPDRASDAAAWSDHAPGAQNRTKAVSASPLARRRGAWLRGGPVGPPPGRVAQGRAVAPTSTTTPGRRSSSGRPAASASLKPGPTNDPSGARNSA
jgi:hypothetical protein